MPNLLVQAIIGNITKAVTGKINESIASRRLRIAETALNLPGILAKTVDPIISAEIRQSLNPRIVTDQRKPQQPRIKEILQPEKSDLSFLKRRAIESANISERLKKLGIKSGELMGRTLEETKRWVEDEEVRVKESKDVSRRLKALGIASGQLKDRTLKESKEWVEAEEIRVKEAKDTSQRLKKLGIQSGQLMGRTLRESKEWVEQEERHVKESRDISERLKKLGIRSGQLMGQTLEETKRWVEQEEARLKRR